MDAADRKLMRRLIADYMQSEGCSCCRDVDGHDKHKAAIAKVLNVPKYSDGYGYNFNQYATEPTT